MIKLLEASIKYKRANSVIAKTKCGIGYEVLLSLKTLEKVEEGEEREFFISQIIREDANLLFGFLEEEEQEMFEALQKVSGIGPSTALNVCSLFSYDEFLQILEEQDENALIKVNKIGKKGAKKLLAELSDYNFSKEATFSSYKKDAILALKSLAFEEKVINEVLKSCKSQNTQELIKEALQKLGK